MEFEGKVALVTGASSGIGRATAEILGSRGARVVVHYFNNSSGARAAVETIGESGSQAVAVQADLSRPEGVRKLQKEAREAFGPIDILVNNAGNMVRRCSIRDADEELFDEVMDLNFKIVFRVTRAFLDDMIDKGGGAIVNMASIAGRNGGGPGAGLYASSKAAAMCLSKAMAKEFIPYGIRVNAVNPGIILTPFHDQHTSSEMMKNFVKGVPLQRGGTPQETAEVIAFLASDRSSYLVGESIEINGGLLMD